MNSGYTHDGQPIEDLDRATLINLLAAALSMNETTLLALRDILAEQDTTAARECVEKIDAMAVGRVVH